MNGVALNTAAMNIMQFAAPLIGGIAARHRRAPASPSTSMAGCYALAMLTMLPIPTVAAQAGRGGGGLREALRRHRSTASATWPATACCGWSCCSPSPSRLLGTPFQGLLPGFVQDAFDAGPALAASVHDVLGHRRIPGRLIIASLRRSGRGKLLILMGVFVGVEPRSGIAISPWIWLSLPIMILMGVGQSGRMAMASALIQEQAEPAYRGRAMSVLMMQFAVMQGGVFVLGIVAELVGIRLAVFVVGVALLGVLALFAMFSPTLRRLQ